MTPAEAEALLRKHAADVNTWPCKLCGIHKDFYCDCGWEAEDNSGSAYTDHLVDVFKKWLAP